MSTPQAPTAAPPRALGLWMCIALVVGNTIGMGIFLLPASLAPYGFNATIGWIVVVVGCLALARVFAGLARVLPEADGPYGYIRATLGDLPAFLALWSYWISTWVTNASLATGVVGYASAVFPGIASVPAMVPAIVFVWLFVALNLLGARAGGRMQVATTVLKLMPMLAVAALGAWLLATQPATFAQHAPKVPLSGAGVMAAASIALFALLGFESAAVGAANVVDPGRTIPRATIIGTMLVAAVYLVVSTVPMLLIPGNELATSSAPFATVMDRYVAPGAGGWLALFAVVSGLGCLNGWTLLCGEMTRTMAAGGTLPRVLSHVNARGAPDVALVVTGLTATGMIVMSQEATLVDSFTFLSQVVTAGNLPLYGLAAAAAFVLRRRGIASASWLAMGLGAAFVVFCVFGMGTKPALLALGLAAAGLPIYAAMRLRKTS